MSNYPHIAAVILAAGKGTRFQLKDKNKQSLITRKLVNKVTLPLAGKPIILYSLELFEKLGIEKIFVVVGFAKESIEKILAGHKIAFVEQKEQLGTGHALLSVLENLLPSTHDVLVINGDDPFHKEESIKLLIEKHEVIGGSVTFTTTNLSNPAGMGRIVRDNDGKVKAIIEEKDATDEQRGINEANGACYIFSLGFLKTYLPELAQSKVTGEYYITALIENAIENGEKVETISVDHKWKGINTPQDLKEAEKLINSGSV